MKRVRKNEKERWKNTVSEREREKRKGLENKERI
jgi:hypothetical protein